MAESSHGNAMTEIALALAMAFFSIMVLTMVSMGATPHPLPEAQAKSAATPTMKVAKNNPRPAAGAKTPAKKQLVIYWQGRFLDRQLQPVNPKAFDNKSPLVLAMPPDLPMADALAARARFTNRNTIVSALDRRWIERLNAITEHGGQP